MTCGREIRGSGRSGKGGRVAQGGSRGSQSGYGRGGGRGGQGGRGGRGGQVGQPVYSGRGGQVGQPAYGGRGGQVGQPAYGGRGGQVGQPVYGGRGGQQGQRGRGGQRGQRGRGGQQGQMGRGGQVAVYTGQQLPLPIVHQVDRIEHTAIVEDGRVVASLPVNTSRLGGPQTNVSARVPGTAGQVVVFNNPQVMAAVAQQAMEEAGTDTAFGYVMPVDTVAFQLASRRFRSHRRRLNPLDSRVYRLLPNYGDSGRVQDVTENSSLTPREIARIRAFFTEPVPELASMHTPAPETPSAPTSVPELASVSVPAPASAPDPAPGPAPAAATAYNAVQPTQRPLRHIIARGQFGEEDEIDYSDDEVQVDADVQGGGGGDRPPQDYDGDSHMNLDAA